MRVIICGLWAYIVPQNFDLTPDELAFETMNAPCVAFELKSTDIDRFKADNPSVKWSSVYL